MTPNSITITGDVTWSEAYRIMRENDTRSLLVVEDSKLIGIVTCDDLREAAAIYSTALNVFSLGRLLERVTVNEIMVRDPITVTSTTTVSQAAKIILEHHIGGLPVVDDGKLVGIITESDIFRLLIASKAA